MIHKRPRRRKKDILNLALKSLEVNQELICTSRAWDEIKDRVQLFSNLNPRNRYVAINQGVTRKVKRLA